MLRELGTRATNCKHTTTQLERTIVYTHNHLSVSAHTTHPTQCTWADSGARPKWTDSHSSTYGVSDVYIYVSTDLTLIIFFFFTNNPIDWPANSLPISITSQIRCLFLCKNSHSQTRTGLALRFCKMNRDVETNITQQTDRKSVENFFFFIYKDSWVTTSDPGRDMTKV